MMDRVPSCDILVRKRNGDASFFVSDIGLGDSANSDWFGIIYRVYFLELNSG